MSGHTLYRFFDRSGQLLYVGRTISPANRWRTHERKSSWFDAVASVTRDVFPTADAVDRAERTAIATEAPIHNIRLKPAPEPTPIATDGHVPRRLLYGLDDVAQRASVSRRVVDRLVRDGEIASVLLGRRRLVSHEALEDYVARLVAAS